MDYDNQELQSAERRNFLKLSGAGAFTAAMVAGGAGTLWSTEAAAQTQQEEAEREAAAAISGVLRARPPSARVQNIAAHQTHRRMPHSSTTAAAATAHPAICGSVGSVHVTTTTRSGHLCVQLRVRMRQADQFDLWRGGVGRRGRAGPGRADDNHKREKERKKEVRRV